MGGCVTKGRFQAQVVESQSLAEHLKQEQLKSAGLEKEAEGLKRRLEEANRQAARKEDEFSSTIRKLESQIEETRSAASKREKELSDKVAVLEQQLALALEMGNKAERELKGEMVRMKGAFEEADQAQQARIEDLQAELAQREGALLELQDRLTIQAEEVAKLTGALQITEAEAAQRERELQEATQTREDLIGKLQKEIQEGSITISQMKDRLSVEIVDKILFPSGSDQITGEGKEVLKKVSGILKEVKENNIRIEGHTDNVPIGPRIKDRFSTNWELSTSRATQVVRYLVAQGIDPEKLLAAGMSQFRPVASNETPEGRQRNRRIEIVLFPKDIQEIAAAVE